jgi:O-methyltransferase
MRIKQNADDVAYHRRAGSSAGNPLAFSRRASVTNQAKAILKRAARGFGVEISRVPRLFDGSAYQPVRPLASYSPWNTDAAFRSAYASVGAFTLVDAYRCFELWKLVEQAAKLERGSFIEIGVWRGGTGALIATQAKRCGNRDKVFLCDTFTGVVKAGAKDSQYRGGEHADTDRQTVERLIAEMGLDNVEILQGVFPEDTGPRVQDVQFRFCHIDVDVYQSAKDIVDWIWHKLVPGGIVVYDDYGFPGCVGITRYVEEQTLCGDRILIHNLNGHAVVIKR